MDRNWGLPLFFSVAFLPILGLFNPIIAQQQSHKVHFVVHSPSKHTLKEVYIQIIEAGKDYFTDSKGKYSTYLYTGDYTIKLRKERYFSDSIFISVKKDTSIFITLRPNLHYTKPIVKREKRIDFSKIFELEEVEVIGIKEDKFLSNAPNTRMLEQATVDKLPSFLGEKDPIKIFQMMPGVQAQTEASSEYSVKGGKPDQNLFLLDGMPLYSISHLMGLVSVFNPSFIEQSVLYKADMPARLGGRVSSVLEGSSARASLIEKERILDIGLLSSKIKFSYPLIPNKFAISFGARRTLLDLPYYASISEEGLGFSDLNLSINYKINTHNDLTFTAYRTYDRFMIRSGEDYPIGVNAAKGQTLGVANLHTTYTNNWRSKLSVGVSYFENKIHQSENTGNRIDRRFKSYTDDWVFNSSFVYQKDSVKIDFGMDNAYRKILPIIYNETSTTSFSRQSSADQLFEVIPYISASYQLNRSYISLGLRYSNYMANARFGFLEPRISLSQGLWKNSKLSLSYTRLSQAIHRLSNAGLGFPFDIILYSSAFVRPQISNNYGIHYLQNIRLGKFTYALSISPYYRNINHTINYLDGYDSRSLLQGAALSQSNPLQILATGNTHIRGMDITLEKLTGRLTGWLGYSYLKAIGKYPSLNQGNSFPENNDRRHQINLVGMYQFNKRVNVSASWSFLSGAPITVSTQAYRQAPFPDNFVNMTYSSHYVHAPTQRNAQRMIPFHRLDINANFKTGLFSREGELSLGVFNLYNRANPNFYYIKNNIQNNDEAVQTLKSVSFLPILPVFSMRIFLDKRKASKL